MHGPVGRLARHFCRSKGIVEKKNFEKKEFQKSSGPTKMPAQPAHWPTFPKCLIT